MKVGQKKKAAALVQRPRPASAPPSGKKKKKPTKMGLLIRDVGQLGGSYLGGPVGSQVGRLAGATISRAFGYGDYTITDNQRATSQPVPAFKAGATLVTHREFLTNLTSVGTGFYSTQYIVNPGVSATFPWLSVMAPLYQKYRFRQLLFEFRSMSSEYASGAALGTVVIASNYNANDAAFASKAAMENSSFAVSCKPSEDMVHAVECKNKMTSQTWFYTRDGYNAPSAVQLYDLCNTTVATSGLSAPVGTVIGEIWVTYTVEFMETVLPPAPAAQPFDGAVFASNGYSSAGSTFGQGPLLNSTNYPIAGMIGASYGTALTPSVAVQATPLSYPTTSNMSAYPNAIFLVSAATQTFNSSTTGTSTLYFARNGTYLLNCQFSGMSASFTAPWTISGVGATVQQIPTDSTTTECTVVFYITVVGYSTVGVQQLPSISFLQQITGTFSQASVQLVIAS